MTSPTNKSSTKSSQISSCSSTSPKKFVFDQQTKDNISQIKQRVTKAASEGLSKIAHGKHRIGSQQQLAAKNLTGTMMKTSTSYQNTFSSGSSMDSTSKFNRSASLWNFNDTNCCPTSPSAMSMFQHATVIPVAIQEQIIINELLFCLVGVRGTYIVPDDDTVEGFQMIKFRVSDKIQTSLRDICQEILPLASHYSLVQKFIQETAFSNCGLIIQALSAALQTLIYDYYMSLVQLESEFKDNSLSLHKLLYFIQPTMSVFEHLAETVTTIISSKLHGASVLTFLYRKITALTGDQNAQKIVTHLTKMATVPYIEMLHLWILKGVIQDPQREFLVEDNEIQKQDFQSLDHYSAEYWEKRYTIRLDKCPIFFIESADVILRAGKYLNVIRQCGRQIEKFDLPYDNRVEFCPIEPTKYILFIKNVYTFASRTLLKVLVKDNDLMGHLLSVKKYLLLNQGDFVNQFMDASEKELLKNVDKILPMKLDNLLGLTLRLSSTKYDQYKDDLHCQLFPFELIKQMEKIHLIDTHDEDYWHDDKINLTGLECFAFRYEVRWPISLVLNHFAILKYQIIFRQLFYCKHVERQLCRVWKDNNNTKKFAPETAEQYRSAFTLRQRMMNAIQNLEYYMMIEVIEPTWHDFVSKIDKCENVDEVLSVHQDFLDDCLYNCMLKNPDLLRLVVKLCNICLQFCKFIQKAQQYYLDAELTSMLCSDDSSESESEIDLLSYSKQSETSLAPNDTFSERIKRFDLEFTFVLIGLLKKINELTYDNPSSKLINLVHRINFNSFYNHQLEQVSGKIIPN